MRKKSTIRTPKKKTSLWTRPPIGEHVPRNAYDQRDASLRLERDLAMLGIAPEKAAQLSEVYLEKGASGFEKALVTFAQDLRARARKAPKSYGPNFETITTKEGSFSVPRETYDLFVRNAKKANVSLQVYAAQWLKRKNAKRIRKPRN